MSRMDTVTQQNAGQETPHVITEVRAWANGWSDIVAFLTANPEIAKLANTVHGDYVMCYIGSSPSDPAALMSDAATACVASGGRVEPYTTPEFGGVHLYFGPIYIQVYTERHKVCASRATGMVEKVEYTLTFDLPEQAPAAAS